MIFDRYSELEGKHAFLSPSSSSWVRYTPEKLVKVFNNKKAAELGTRLHAFAKEAIDLGIKLPKTKGTLNLYINDSIGYHMQTEVCLYYGPYCWGWVDAISFDEKQRFLRIHDLKTGEHPATMEQLEIYAALFCLVKHYEPEDIKIELRIYQSNEVLVNVPDPLWIKQLSNIIIDYSKILEREEREVSL